MELQCIVIQSDVLTIGLFYPQKQHQMDKKTKLDMFINFRNLHPLYVYQSTFMDCIAYCSIDSRIAFKNGFEKICDLNSVAFTFNL